MRPSACMPCQARKVRCDRAEPCAHCTRRAERCVYPDQEADRIKKLEALVRALGGDPDVDDELVASRLSKSEHGKAPKEQREQREQKEQDKDAVLVEENGESYYLESRVWHNWLGNAPDHNGQRALLPRNPFAMQNNPHAFQGVWVCNRAISLADLYPALPLATMLWSVFYDRVDPLARISFSWTLKRLQDASTSLETLRALNDADHAYLCSIYLASFNSLTEEECSSNFNQPKAVLLDQYHFLCEEALSRTNILCMTDITVIKALTMYMSLWSLMGLTVRNAERLGMHRDGAILGLAPAATEERRRLWWRLQHLDLALAVRSGMTPITLRADWDVKLPLNIEDEDLEASATQFPKERSGMTRGSYCLFTYWVLDQQRQLCKSGGERFQLSWQTSESMSLADRQMVIQKLEDGLNRNFLQYCDPIRPIDNLLQLTARMLVCGLRMRTLHPVVTSGSIQSLEHRRALLDASMHLLQYNAALNSQASIRRFQQLTRNFMPWHAFMCVLVEESQQSDQIKTQQIWSLLADLYAANEDLFQLVKDRRRRYAAELVVAAWNSRQHKLGPRKATKPDFVERLEQLVAGQADSKVPDLPFANAKGEAHGIISQADAAMPELDFGDVDWAFWASME